MDIGITEDMDLIESIIKDPEIWERASEDNIGSDTFKPMYDDYCHWLICRDNHTIIGIIYIHSETSVSFDMHIYTIKEHRKKGKEMTLLFFKWFLEKTNANKLNASIPVFYPEVINFALNVGFKEEGLNRESYAHNGLIHDQQNLGITRKEIEDLI